MSQVDPVVIVSSSPDFPPIHKLLAQSPRKPSRSGSNATPIPDNAPTTFTAAASIWKSLHGGAGVYQGALHGSITAGAVLESPLTIEQPAESERREAGEEKPRQKKKRSTTATTRQKRAVKLDAVDEVQIEATVELPVETAPVPKPRRKAKPKDQDDVQTTIPKGKVTKVAAKSRAPRKKAETVSRHFGNTSAKPVANTMEDEPVLEQAMRRRMDWTPPPDDTVPPPRGGSPTVEEKLLTNLESSAQSPSLQKVVFKDLLDAYNHKMDDEQANGGLSVGAQASNDVLGKRKLIELATVATTKATSPDVSPVKPKAPKKKPRTITELATAAYRVVEDNEDSTYAEKPKQDSVFSYFDAETGGKDGGGKSKSSKKATKPKASKKKAEPRKQVLLSPASALKQVSVQDFVFGTASQLATEDDPDLLRALHGAMQASNQPESDPFTLLSPVVSELASRNKAGNKLWGVGARDDDGDLLELEPVDLTESPSVVHQDYSLPRDPSVTPMEPVKAVQSKKIQIEVLSSELDSVDLTDSPSINTISKPSFFSSQMNAQSLKKEATPKLPPLPKNVEKTRNNHFLDLDLEPPPSNQEHNQLITQSQICQPEPPSNLPARPKYELFTDARLAKEINSYGFKPIKKRKTMITLLNQCWETKHKAPGAMATQTAPSASTAAQAGDTTSSTSISSPSRPRGRPKKAAVAAPVADPPVSPSRPRGRPRKSSEVVSPQAASKSAPSRAKKASSRSPKRASKAKAASKAPTAASTPKRRKVTPASQTVFEIADSDASDLEDPFLSSPTSSLEKLDDPFSSSPEQLMNVSITEDTEDASLMATASPTTQQALLFKHITEAITTAPRTTNPAEPSWHEKMLMYDPVILEDLTAWLNSGQLDRIGFDGEVAPDDVKLWCQSKSVCCLWRVNLHGKARKRF